MNRLKYFVLFLLISLLSLASAPLTFAGSVKSASVVVYNSGRALVTEARSVKLPKGMASVVFKDVPTTLDPTSVRASASGMSVLDLQYSYIPITTNNLLNRYLGKELTVIMPDPTDGDARILRKATLVSNVDRPVFLVGNEVYLGNYEALLFPELPKDLQRQPTLTLTTDNKSAGKRDVRLSYLMGGLNWRADYAVTVNAKGNVAALDAWATLENSSGRGFTNASLTLVAGDVQQANSPRRNGYAKAAMYMEADTVGAAAPLPPSEEQFSQYHIYSFGRSVSLAESGTKQLSLFSAPTVDLKQELVSLFNGSRGQRSAKVEQNVELSLRFTNTKQNGLGRPMPAGLVRVFMPTQDGRLLLAGESRIGHVAEGGETKLVLGRAFDVTVQRSQTSFKKLGKNSYEMGWRIEVLNGKDTQQSLTLKDRYSGQWKVTVTDQNYTKPDAGTLEYKLMVPPTKGGKPMVVNYTVQVAY
ncbi:MAG: DUF4139 domain-containing protein [Pseudodesulfovibrio sp.]